MLPLVLYDIPSNAEGCYWSPNTAKPRFVLSYKGLPFEIDWLELPDIAPRMKEIGAAPGRLADGSETYTLPVLHDPNTGACVTDSFEIAVYLDNTYPEKPVFPKDTEGLIRVFADIHTDQLMPAIKFLAVRTVEIMREPSAEHYITTREKSFNQKLAEFSPEGSERDKHWSTLEKAFVMTKRWYDKTDGKWLMGDTFSYADIIAACRLFWFKKVLHDDEWRRIAAWHDGQWERLLAGEVRRSQMMAYCSALRGSSGSSIKPG